MSAPTSAQGTRSSHGYAYGFQPRSTDVRPLVALGVDGVLALDADPLVPTTSHTVSAHGRWTRDIELPDGAAQTISRLSESAELVWVGPWSYLAHEALAPALGLHGEPWPFLPAQFDAVPMVRAYAAGRPWALVTEDKTSSDDAPDGVVIVVDPRRGITDVDADLLIDALQRAET